ncbi:MAG: putative outer membrane protein [Rhodobacteraceae bacterium HLUCCA08]|nr:MAG: putative outer membrane protein [Rhodobacteraceae bacterium HLUCCA08]
MKTYLTIAAMICAAPALAGNLSDPIPTPAPAPVAAPMPVAGTDWSGAYAGGYLGNIDTSGLAALDGTGFGVFGGYQADLGNVVIGGELDYGRYSFDTAGDPDASVLRLKGRVGYDAGRVLPYLALGFAQLDSDDLAIDKENGTFYGLGADFAVTDSIRLGAEYLRHDFDDIGLEANTLSLRAAYSF